uniref:CSON009219 protein n=1 Tax=Culicoides sonorensis TaxID=179676 RepID=A0A336KJX5_CULSO
MDMKLILVFISLIYVCVEARPEPPSRYGAPTQQSQFSQFRTQQQPQQQIFEHHKSSFQVPSQFSQDFNANNHPVSIISVQPSISKDYSLPVESVGYQNQNFVSNSHQGPVRSDFANDQVSSFGNAYTGGSEIRGQGLVQQTYSTPTFSSDNTQSYQNQGFGSQSSSNNNFNSHSGQQQQFQTGFTPSRVQLNTNQFESQNVRDSVNVPVQTIVTKDIYVHSAPPDEPEEFASQSVQPQVNRKNYKIIFIKTPSLTTQQQIQYQQQAQNEEKTIVYVLVKKPELNNEVLLAQNPVQKVNKPEVYFIKYKAHKGREQYSYNTTPKSTVNTANTELSHNSQSVATRTSLSSDRSDTNTNNDLVAQSHKSSQDTSTGILKDSYTNALEGIEHTDGHYPEEKRTRKSNYSPYGPSNFNPGTPLG